MTPEQQIVKMTTAIRQTIKVMGERSDRHQRMLQGKPNTPAHARHEQHQAIGRDRSPPCAPPSTFPTVYVEGDSNDQATFTAIRPALGRAPYPTHYLAIPPALFATVVQGLAASGLAEHARVSSCAVRVPGRIDLPY